MRNILRLIRLMLYVGVPFLVAVLTFQFMRSAFFLPLDPSSTEKVFVEIGPSKSFRDIARELEEKKVLRYAQSLQIVARLDDSEAPIKPGEYEVSASMTPRAILKHLQSGKVHAREIHI